MGKILISQRKDLPKCSGIYFAIDNQGELHGFKPWERQATNKGWFVND
jgi:hypothetical protein